MVSHLSLASRLNMGLLWKVLLEKRKTPFAKRKSSKMWDSHKWPIWTSLKQLNTSPELHKKDGRKYSSTLFRYALSKWWPYCKGIVHVKKFVITTLMKLAPLDRLGIKDEKPFSVKTPWMDRDGGCSWLIFIQSPKRRSVCPLLQSDGKSMPSTLTCDMHVTSPMTVN